MITNRIRRSLVVGATLAVAAIGSAAPAQASAQDCDTRLERLEAQFYEMADRRGYETATEWWEARWHAYFQSCVIH
jgi:hypothetical protein